MNTIELSKVLSNDTRKTTKIKAFDILKLALEDSNLEFTEELSSALKTIYPATKAKDIKDYWSLLMKFAGKKDIRYYLNGIYVKDNKTLVSSNGHTLCSVEFTSEEYHNLKVGALYENNKNKIIVEGQDQVKYPVFKTLIETTFKGVEISLDSINNGYDKVVNGMHYNKVGGHYYLNDSLKLIPAKFNDSYVSCDNDKAINVLKVVIVKDDYIITLYIMPARIK